MKNLRLQLGSAAFQNDNRYLHKSLNFSDLISPSLARDNLGLGDSATRNVGTATNNVLGVNTFGLGNNHILLNDTDDLNNVLIFGIYKHDDNFIPDNTPINENGILIVRQGEPDTLVHQEWTSLDSTRRYIRNYNGSTWDTWYELSFDENKYIFRGEYGIDSLQVLDNTDNLNNITDFGFYVHNDSSLPVNVPENEPGYLFVRQGTPNTYILQEWASRLNTANTRKYHRVRDSGGSWSDWVLSISDKPRYENAFNTLKSSGIYFWDNSSTNGPSANFGSSLRLNSNQSSSSPYGMLAFDLNNNTPNLFVRSTDNDENNPGDWEEVWHTGNLNDPVQEIQTKNSFDFYNSYEVPNSNPGAGSISDMRVVILLFPTDPNGNNQCMGTFLFRNLSSLNPALSSILTVNAISSNNDITAQIVSLENEVNDKFKLVTFDYNSVEYLGIDFNIDTSEESLMDNRYFTGLYNTSDSEELQVIPYFNVSTSSVIDSEINDSISDYESNNEQVVFSNDGVFKGKRGVVISSGDTSERPSNPSIGTLRFNTDIDNFEFYNGTSWVSVGGNVEDAELLAALAFVSA